MNDDDGFGAPFGVLASGETKDNFEVDAPGSGDLLSPDFDGGGGSAAFAIADPYAPLPALRPLPGGNALFSLRLLLPAELDDIGGGGSDGGGKDANDGGGNEAGTTPESALRSEPVEGPLR